MDEEIFIFCDGNTKAKTDGPGNLQLVCECGRKFHIRTTVKTPLVNEGFGMVRPPQSFDTWLKREWVKGTTKTLETLETRIEQLERR